MSAFLFPETWNLVFNFQWSLRFHFHDFSFFSFFFSSLSFSLTLAVCRSSSSAWALFYLIFLGHFSLDKEIEETSIGFRSFLDLDPFLVLQTIRMETYQLIIFSLLFGHWTTSLPRYASFLSFGSFVSLLLRVLLWGWVYLFVAMP